MQDVFDIPEDDDCKRGEARILSEVTVFVETFASPSGETRSPNILISKTLDLSANGLQVVMDSPINLGSILQLCVMFDDDGQQFHLIGEVRWVSKTRFENSYLVGFMLLDSDGCHIEEWKHKISDMLGNPALQVH